jgi:predicted dehydrogenase
MKAYMDKKIRVGIVGVTPDRSWAARAHIPALRALPGFEITGVASSTENSARLAADAFDIPNAFPSVAALAEDPTVDLVAITVKVPHHKELVDTVLDAGKMVYCEWPLGNGLAEAKAMAARARELGVRTVVGLQARSSPTIRYVRDLIRAGYIGNVLSTSMIGSAGGWGPVAQSGQIYLNDRSNGATALTIPFGHTIDALCWCLGEFREVSAVLDTRRKTFTVAETKEVLPMNADDQIVVSGVLDNGIIASVHYRGGVSRGTNFLWEINGTEGDLHVTARLGHAQLTDLTLRGGNGADTELSVMEIPPQYRTVPTIIVGPAVNVAETYARFAAGLSVGDPAPDFGDALRRHELLDAIERSSQTGQRVRI